MQPSKIRAIMRAHFQKKFPSKPVQSALMLNVENFISSAELVGIDISSLEKDSQVVEKFDEFNKIILSARPI